jgi:predicted enzyme related to lactoylglutathione lyase
MPQGYRSSMDLTNKMGKVTWFDLPATDTVNARMFYEGLFGWEFLLMREPSPPDYWVIQAGNEMIGGIRKVAEKTTTDRAPILYFTVDELPRYTLRVKELGGKLVGDPVNLGNGRGSYQWFRDREENLVALWAPEPATAQETL